MRTMHSAKARGVGGQRPALAHGCRRSARVSALRVSCALPAVMVNSCSGKMGHAAAEALVVAGFQLVPWSFTGLSVGVAVKSIGVRGVPVQLVDAAKRQAIMNNVKEQHPDVMVVDFTVTHCVQDNAEFYAANGLPFVMGTTGGDRDEIRQLVASSGTYAVTASREWREAAGVASMLQVLGADVPADLSKYRLEEEGVKPAGRGGPPAGALTPLRARSPAELMAVLASMGIESDAVKVARHWQTRMQAKRTAPQCRYRLSLADRSRSFTFSYDQSARRTVYAQSTVEAVRFLKAHMEQGSAQRCYDMLDVLAVQQQQQRAKSVPQARAGAVARAPVASTLIPA